MSATAGAQHGEEIHQVSECVDVCVAELARAVTMVHDVTSYLYRLCGNPLMQLLWDPDIW